MYSILCKRHNSAVLEFCIPSAIVSLVLLFITALPLVIPRYFVTHLMGADLNNIVKCQKLTDDHVQFLIYQILRGLKVRPRVMLS